MYRVKRIIPYACTVLLVALMTLFAETLNEKEIIFPEITALAVGYDVQSVELDARKRYIEVKTTISNKPINFFTFHLTPNEWDTASTLSDRYFVYRLMISKNSLTIYVLQDPVHMYKKNQISLTIRDGAEITFNAEHCEKTNLKIWKG